METDSLVADPEESALRELGQEVDHAEGRQETPAAETAPPKEPEATPEPPTGELEQKPVDTEPKQPGRDDTGKFTKQPQKPETDYSRAQKEEIRKERTWAMIQARREEVDRIAAQQQEAIRMQQLEAARATFQPIRKEGLTAQEYYDGYQRFRQNGDYENAARALETAIEIQNAENSRTGYVQAVNAEYSWRKGMDEAAQANPEVMNPESPVAAQIQRIVADHGDWLMQHPRGYGFQLAAEVAQMLARDDYYREVEDDNVRLRAENEKLRGKARMGKSGYAAPRTSDKEFDDMDLNEMESHLKSLTQEADNYR